VPYQRLAAAVLEEWRGLERQLGAMNPMGPAAEALESYRLRNRYQDRIDQATANPGRYAITIARAP
jgi:hypothetical protein